MAAYDTFADAAATNALKVVLQGNAAETCQGGLWIEGGVACPAGG